MLTLSIYLCRTEFEFKTVTDFEFETELVLVVFAIFADRATVVRGKLNSSSEKELYFLNIATKLYFPYTVPQATLTLFLTTKIQILTNFQHSYCFQFAIFSFIILTWKF